MIGNRTLYRVFVGRPSESSVETGHAPVGANSSPLRVEEHGHRSIVPCILIRSWYDLMLTVSHRGSVRSLPARCLGPCSARTTASVAKVIKLTPPESIVCQNPCQIDNPDQYRTRNPPIKPTSPLSIVCKSPIKSTPPISIVYQNPYQIDTSDEYRVPKPLIKWTPLMSIVHPPIKLTPPIGIVYEKPYEVDTSNEYRMPKALSNRQLRWVPYTPSPGR
jgi:hypothetical protein